MDNRTSGPLSSAIAAAAAFVGLFIVVRMVVWYVYLMAVLQAPPGAPTWFQLIVAFTVAAVLAPLAVRAKGIAVVLLVGLVAGVATAAYMASQLAYLLPNKVIAFAIAMTFIEYLITGAASTYLLMRLRQGKASG